MSPVTKVLDRSGNVIHDCVQAGCSVSWDGYDLETGDPVDGRADPGPEWEPVDAATVRRVAQAGDGQPPPGSIDQG